MPDQIFGSTLPNFSDLFYQGGTYPGCLVVRMKQEKRLVWSFVLQRCTTLMGWALLSCALVTIHPDHIQASDLDSAITRVPRGALSARFHRQVVRYPSVETQGTVIVDLQTRYLYLIQGEGRAVRYGISVGSAAFAWSGEATVGRKAAWPRWTPTREMMARDPGMTQYHEGVAPGPTNPLGARALYLKVGGRDTFYRLHGTSEYWSIGKAASFGCVRLLNQDIIDLFERVPVGAKVIVLEPGSKLKWNVQ